MSRIAAYNAAERAAQAHAEIVATHDAQITTAAARHDATAQQAIVIRYRTITNEVHDVVTPAIDARYPLPVGFVRVHDAAALGLDLSASSTAARPADDTASPIKASDALSVIVGNYGECHVDQQRLIDLQSWASAVYAANPGTSAAK